MTWLSLVRFHITIRAFLLHFPSSFIFCFCFLWFSGQLIDEWTFDVFALSDVSAGSPLRYLGIDLLNRYGVIHKFKVDFLRVAVKNVSQLERRMPCSGLSASYWTLICLLTCTTSEDIFAFCFLFLLEGYVEAPYRPSRNEYLMWYLRAHDGTI